MTVVQKRDRGVLLLYEEQRQALLVPVIMKGLCLRVVYKAIM